MRCWRLVFVVVAALLATACSERDLSGLEPVGTAADNIINGTTDTTHQAVVAWLHGSKCSATIIDRNGSTGYALTAAHCVGGSLGDLYQGNNHDNPTRTYPVVQAVPHPEYSVANAYDVAMLRFSGADAATPVIPALAPAPDSMSAGTQVELVGYGQLNGSVSTSLRHHVTVPLDSEDTVSVRFNQSIGGICSGDSGGALLHTFQFQQYVGGVHTGVSSTNCTGTGSSMRSSAVYNTFIMPFIANSSNPSYLPQSCDQCTDAHLNDGQCTDELSDCFDNNACSTYRNCLYGCTTSPCVVQCALDHAAGKTMYDQIFGCVCNQACSSECSGDSLCDDDPPCWLTTSNAACQSCIEGSCCSQATQCAADNACMNCLTSALPAPTCADDAKFNAFTTCLSGNCADDCSYLIPGGEGGSGAAGQGGAGQGGTPSTGGYGTGLFLNYDDDDDDDGFQEGGCACAQVAPSRHRRLAWLLLAASVVAVRRRRRAR